MTEQKLFIIIVKYLLPLEKVDEHLLAHKDYLQKYYAAGVFLASGPQVPRFGGIILAKSNSRKTLYAILAEDPFQQQLCAEYQVHEFGVNNACSSFESFLQESGLKHA